MEQRARSPKTQDQKERRREIVVVNAREAYNNTPVGGESAAIPKN